MQNNLATDKGLAEIRQIFITECNDGLDVIESGLLELEKGNDNKETINDIFRGAHSIKGGAATFGYSSIAEFTHVLETLLDKLRSGEMGITPPLVKLFLESVDCLREMVQAMDGDGEYNRERADDVKVLLNGFLGNESQEESTSEDDEEEAATEQQHPGGRAWDIAFRPKTSFLKHGNQPHHIFRALSELGKVTLTPLLDQLPEFGSFNSEEMYLAWDIALEADVSLDTVRDVFDWVEFDCEVNITERVLGAKVEHGVIEAPVKAVETTPVTAAVEAVQKIAPPVEAEKHEKKAAKKDAASTSIRVDIEKIDVLLNLVGEMVINQAMLNQLARNKNGKESSMELEQGLALLERTTRELQEAVMEIRMLPVSVTFSRFPRLVYDLSAKLKKKVELKITGEQTELDKTVLEKIGDPILHLIRNSLDHGIESPQDRLAIGKDETGIIHLSASHEGGSVVIRVTDDGAGLNTDKILKKAVEKKLVSADAKLTNSEVNDLIFLPGFSTADVVTDVSGRGVGMDVVRRNIEEIGGRVEVYSERGKGSTFLITLPLTLAILDGQLVRVANEIYVLPLLSIVETVQVKEDRINVISGGEVVYRLRGKAVPVVDMRKVCRVPGSEPLESYSNKQIIIVESDRKAIGLVVDELLDQHQVVIKSLETNFVKVPGMLGATILGDGTVSLILDVTTLSDVLNSNKQERVVH
jgi:two-component system, chemotaxis family, sensor kinase CheA